MTSSIYQTSVASSPYDDNSDSTTHNPTERKYRNRPASTMNTQYTDEEVQAKRISKAEVLDLAEERIEELGKRKGRRDCECGRCKLQENFDLLTFTYGNRISAVSQFVV
jgi:hypothetical protein